MIPYGFLYRGMTRNQTVSLDDDGDLVFRALADKSRRELLDRLYERAGQSLSELCEGLEMTRPAVAKHLRILEQASLVSFERKGREKLHYLNPVPINGIAERWIGKFERPNLRVLSDLKDLLEAPTPDRGHQVRRPKGRADD
jgi:DNA-binding transcriptional ArsR family regulator